jgi:hypothetical protein
MNHIDEDRLLNYALEAYPNDEERAVISGHLMECSECRGSLVKLRNDIKVIGSIRPRERYIRLPGPIKRSPLKYSILKAAALIIIGILIGIGLSNFIYQSKPSVAPMRIKISPPGDSVGRYAVSDATDFVRHQFDLGLESR